MLKIAVQDHSKTHIGAVYKTLKDKAILYIVLVYLSELHLKMVISKMLLR